MVEDLDDILGEKKTIRSLRSFHVASVDLVHRNFVTKSAECRKFRWSAKIDQVFSKNVNILGRDFFFYNLAKWSKLNVFLRLLSVMKVFFSEFRIVHTFDRRAMNLFFGYDPITSGVTVLRQTDHDCERRSLDTSIIVFSFHSSNSFLQSNKKFNK